MMAFCSELCKKKKNGRVVVLGTFQHIRNGAMVAFDHVKKEDKGADEEQLSRW